MRLLNMSSSKPPRYPYRYSCTSGNSTFSILRQYFRKDIYTIHKRLTDQRRSVHLAFEFVYFNVPFAVKWRFLWLIGFFRLILIASDVSECHFGLAVRAVSRIL